MAKKKQTRKPQSTRLSKLERTAYHEAGHAVMLHELGRRITRITIEPGDGALGSVHHPSPFKKRKRPPIQVDDPSDKAAVAKAKARRMQAAWAEDRSCIDLFNNALGRRRVEDAIKVCLAGQAAEFLATGGRRRNWIGARFDLVQAYGIAQDVCAGESGARHYVQRLGEEALHLLDEVWPRVEALAQALLAQALLAQALLAQALLAQALLAQALLAQALLALPPGRRSLSGRQATEVILSAIDGVDDEADGS